MAPFWRWDVSFTTCLRNGQGRVYGGYVDLEIQTLLFTLHGKDGVLVDRIKFADGHSTQPGDTLEFPCHFAKIRSQILDHWKVSYTTLFWTDLPLQFRSTTVTATA